MLGLDDGAAASRRPRRPLPAIQRVVLEIVMSTLALGAVIGVLWWQLAPEIVGEVQEGGGVAFDIVAHQESFGRDGVFGLLGLSAGVLLAAIFGMRFRRRPVTALVALTLSGGAASVLALWLGQRLGPGSLDARAAGADVGDLLAAPLDVDAYGVLLAWPLAVAVTFAIIAVFRDDRTLWSARSVGHADPPASYSDLQTGIDRRDSGL